MDKIKAWQIFRTIPGFINKNSDFFAIQRGIHLVVTWTDLSSFFWEYRTPISFYRIRTTPGTRMTFDFHTVLNLHGIYIFLCLSS